MRASNFAIPILAAIALIGGIYLLVRPKPVTTIGSWKIYAADVEKRNEVDRIFFPESGGKGGRAQLERSAKYLKILEKNGVTVSREEILAEAARIDRDTKDPALLAKIKSAFRGDYEAYLQNYVKPTLLDRIVPFEFYPNHTSFHQDTFKIAQNFIEKARTEPKIFKTLAAKENILIKRMTVHRTLGFQWHLPGIEKKFIPAEPWLVKLAFSTPLGQISEQPISRGPGWIVVHPVSRTKDETELEIAEIPKISFEKWMSSELESAREDQ